MKKLLTGLAAALLSFVPLTSEAEIIAKADNKSGGGIFLTNTKCSKGGHVIMARLKGGQTAFGCFVHEGDFIIARYDDGSTYTYEVGDFSVIEPEASQKPSSARSVPNL